MIFFSKWGDLDKRTPQPGPGQSLILVGYSSVFLEIPESRIPLCVSTPTYMCLYRYPVNGKTNKHSRSVAWETWPLPQSSNLARSASSKFQTISSIYTHLERGILVCGNYFAIEVWNPTSIFFRKLNAAVHGRLQNCIKVQI